MEKLFLQPLSLYAQSVVCFNETGRCINIYSDIDNHLIRVTGAFTDKDKQLAKEHISKHNKNNWSIHFE